MALTIKEVEHVALLARLNLSPGEKEIFAQQLGSILEYFGMLNRLSTDGVEPLAHVLPLANVMRDDVTWLPLLKEDILANAPLEEEGQFKVPKII
ncbi:MAG: Asp-tRNA(Asn)/Glu-tRNA(Gln) amidotransferase subunit GatC [Syntrophomonadaceae bacterium]|nr:Asp-tRNA(Asn)/Glu-tRNA(Gln) amidotransferase subunit GatC [Syntrophomonadaceae bacterium]